MEQFSPDPSNSDYSDDELFNTQPSQTSMESFSTGHSFLSTDSLSSDSSEFSGRRVGRKMLNETIFLSEYSTQRWSKHPKKENLRVQMYRGFLQCVKCLGENKLPTRRVNKFDEQDLQVRGSLEELEKTYRLNKGMVDYMASLYRNPQVCPSHYSSFKLGFYREALASSAMKECFNKYIDFVFADCSPSIMEKRLNLKHYDPLVSMEPWVKLRDYIKEQLYEDAFCPAAVSQESSP